MVTRARSTAGRTTHRAPSNASTTPQRDEATGDQARRRARGSEYAGMKLPHEHDESAEQDSAGRRPEIEKGAADLEQGRRDTDCYTAAGPRYRRQQRKRR
jgi:hypothetical protein